MAEYRFVFMQETDGASSGLPAQKADSGLPQSNSSDKNGVVQAFGNKVASAAENAVLAPLNSVTGGMARPIYNVGKSLIQGASAGAIAGGLAGVAIAGVKLVIDGINKRIAELENQAKQANERDNALIRAGTVSHATFYETNGLIGIKEKQR